MSKPNTYVAGFMFDHNLERVVLIRKKKPDFMRGRLNGVGGKVEDFDESNHHAIAREFVEETGLDTHPSEWTEFAVLTAPMGEIHFFCAIGDVDEVYTTTDEEVRVYYLDGLPSLNTVPNLQWLIPMSLQHEDLSLPIRLVENF